MCRTAIIVIAIFFAYTTGLYAQKQPTRHNDTYTLYPAYALITDSMYKGNLYYTCPVRICNSAKDTMYICFRDLFLLKLDQFRSMSLKDYYRKIVKKVYSGQCIYLTGIPDREILKIPLKEYRKANPDAIIKKYFPKGYFGDMEDTIRTPRELEVGLVALFDNNYIISSSCSGAKYTIKKEPDDKQVKEFMRKYNIYFNW